MKEKDDKEMTKHMQRLVNVFERAGAPIDVRVEGRTYAGGIRLEALGSYPHPFREGHEDVLVYG